MPKQFNKGEMEARTGQTMAQKAKWRVKAAVPEYFFWPRRLRLIYTLLTTHGSSDASIRAMCSEFGWDHDETREMIAEEEGFLERLLSFRELRHYPKLKAWRYPLTYEHLTLVYAEEARFEALAKLQASSSGSAATNHWRSMVENSGLMERLDPIPDAPGIQQDAGETAAGQVVDPENAAMIRGRLDQSQRDASLISDWDMSSDWDTEDAVPSSSETAGDAPIESAGEVDSGGSPGRQD